MRLPATFARTLTALAALAAAACSDTSPPTATPADSQLQPQLAISDAANAPGRAGFYWLPPMVSNPGPFPGTFDATLSPTLRLCALVPATAPATGFTCGTVLKTFTTTSASDRIVVDLAGQSYSVNWNTKNNPTTLTTGRDKFRIVASVGPNTIGFADLWFVGTSKDLSRVHRGYVGMVLGTSVFLKFRIETQTIGAVTITPAPATVQLPYPGGAPVTQAFTATVTDLKGGVVSGANLQWTSSAPAVASVNPTTGVAITATALTAGTTDITATVGGVTGSASLTVRAAPPPTQLSVTTQPPATAQAGVTLTQQPVVQLRDENGNPVPVAGVVVTAAITTPTAPTSAATPALGGTKTATTDANGVATFTDLAIAGRAGTVATLQFSAPNLAAATSNPITLGAGAPVVLAFLAQPQGARVNEPFGVQVEIRDAYGNLVPTASGVVTLTLGTNPNGAALVGSTALNVVGGLATFSGLSVTKAGTGYTLVASSPGLASATSNAFAILQSISATSLTLGCEMLATTAFLGSDVTVRSTLAVVGSNAPLANKQIEFTVSDGQVSPSVVSTTSAGVATTTWTLPTAGTDATVTCRFVGDDDYTELSKMTGVALTPSATNLAVAQQPSATAQAGVVLAQQPKVQVTNPNGAAVVKSGVVVTAALTEPTDAILGGTTTATTDASGIATFSDLAIAGAAGQTVSLTFTAPALTSATSNGIALKAGTPMVLAFIAQPQGASVNQSIVPAGGVKVAIRDAYGNAATTAINAVTLAIGTNPSGASLGGTTTVAATAGVATFTTLSVDKAGNGYTLQASASGVGQGDTSAPFNVTLPAALISCVAPGTPQVFTNVEVSSTLTDALTGVPLAGRTITFSVGAQDGTFSPQSATSDQDGIARTTWKTGTVARRVTVGCSFAGDATHGAASGSAGASLQPGALSFIRVQPRQATIDGGTSVQFTAIPYDAFDNLITVPVGTANWSSSNTSAVTIDATGKATAANVLSDVTVTITAMIGSESDQTTLTVKAVPQPPTAVDDSWAGSLSGGVLAFQENVMSNDLPGTVSGSVVSFGGGSFPAAYSANGVAQTGTDGVTVSMNPDGTFSFSATVAGTYTFSYTLLSSLGNSSATVTVRVNSEPTGGGSGGDQCGQSVAGSDVGTVGPVRGGKLLDTAVRGTTTAARPLPGVKRTIQAVVKC